MKNENISKRRRLLRSVEEVLEGPMIFLGFIWLILLVLELVWGVNQILEFTILAIWGIFIIDFSIKLFLAPKKLRYLKKDWLTAISLFIPALRILRIFWFVRLLRGLTGIRVVRLLASLNRSMKSLGKTMQRRAFGYVTATLATYFIGLDAEEEDAPMVGAKGLNELKTEIIALRQVFENQNKH